MTAFTVDSYKWLQQDSSDVSNQLLERISYQLSSFSTSGPTINSTTPALSISNITNTFSVDHTSVSVNVLWFVSLTLSLIAALFAIAVQQWLRHHTRPLPSIDIRQAVKLCKVRRDSMKKWLVPGIVSLLPVLLQIAVVFFLVGVLLLLHSLHHTVAVAFTVVAGVGLLAFLGTALLPLVDGRCAYKSPLVPTVLIVLQCLGSLILAIVVYPPGMVLYAFLWSDVVDKFQNLCGYPYMGLFWALDHRLVWLQDYVESFGAHIVVDLDGFWTARELQPSLHSPYYDDLCAALVDVMASIRDNGVFNRVKNRLDEFDVTTKAVVSSRTVLHYAGFSSSPKSNIFKYDYLRQTWVLKVKNLPAVITRRATSWQSRMLLHALWEPVFRDEWDAIPCESILVAWWASQRHNDLHTSFSRFLWTILNEQSQYGLKRPSLGPKHTIASLIMLRYCDHYSADVDRTYIYRSQFMQ